MSTAVEILVDLLLGDGRSITAHIRAPFFLPMREVLLRNQEAGRIELGLRPSTGIGLYDSGGEEVADIPVGTLPILSSLRPGRFETVLLELPPPTPFRGSDIDAMWQAIQQLPGDVPLSVRRDAYSKTGSRLGDQSQVEQLPELLELASEALHRWPSQESVEPYWRPTSLPGGREDAGATLRRLPQARVVRTRAGGLVPERTVRVRAAADPLKLAALSHLAARAACEVRKLGRQRSAYLSGDFTEGASTLLDRVAAVSRKQHSDGADPPASSWPPTIRELYSAIAGFLAGVQADRGAQDKAPLCHLWRLYEAWVSAQVFGAITRFTGHAPVSSAVLGRTRWGACVWRARWDLENGSCLELLNQPEISGAMGKWDLPITSCTSTLIPDCMLLRRSSAGVSAVVLDAKFRGERTLSRGELGEEASKWLWGLRFADGTHAIEHVVIVGSAGSEQAIDPELARVSGVLATPETTAPLDDAVAAMIGLLLRGA